MRRTHVTLTFVSIDSKARRHKWQSHGRRTACGLESDCDAGDRGPVQYPCRACLGSVARAAGRSRSRSRSAPSPLRSRPHGLTWVHLDRPDEQAVSALAERFGWHELDVEDVLSKRQRPKIDEYPDYLFVVLHFPFYDKNVQRLNAAELDVFLGPDYVVTLPAVPLLPVTRLFTRCREDDGFRDELFANGSGDLLYEILDDLLDYCFPILDKIGHKLDSIEDDMFEGASEEVVRDISNVKQEIISYRKIIKPRALDAARARAATSSGSCPRRSSSTSTTSSTPPSGSGTCSTTTRRSSRRSRTRTSR